MPAYTEDQLRAVREAAARLDPEDDAHWTKDGKPGCNVLREACGFDVTRKMADAAQLADRPAFAAPADPVTTEPPQQASLMECNAHMRKVEDDLKQQRLQDTAAQAAAFLAENG